MKTTTYVTEAAFAAIGAEPREAFESYGLRCRAVRTTPTRVDGRKALHLRGECEHPRAPALNGAREMVVVLRPERAEAIRYYGGVPVDIGY